MSSIVNDVLSQFTDWIDVCYLMVVWFMSATCFLLPCNWFEVTVLLPIALINALSMSPHAGSYLDSFSSCITCETFVLQINFSSVWTKIDFVRTIFKSRCSSAPRANSIFWPNPQRSRVCSGIQPLDRATQLLAAASGFRIKRRQSWRRMGFFFHCWQQCLCLSVTQMWW